MEKAVGLHQQRLMLLSYGVILAGSLGKLLTPLPEFNALFSFSTKEASMLLSEGTNLTESFWISRKSPQVYSGLVLKL